MVGRIEQVVLVLAHRLDPVDEGRIDMDVAGRARAAAAAQRQHFVDPGIADRFHHRNPGAGLNFLFLTGTVDHDKLGHLDVLCNSRLFARLPGC